MSISGRCGWVCWYYSKRDSIHLRGVRFVCVRVRVLSIKLNARLFLISIACPIAHPLSPFSTTIYLWSHAMTILDCHGHARSVSSFDFPNEIAFVLEIKFNYFLTCSEILCVPLICLCQFVACFKASVWVQHSNIYKQK